MSPGQDASSVQLATRLIETALAADIRIATAESCTGGLVAAALTAVPGASGSFVGGIVAYSNDVKADWLAVDPALLRDLGAVSEEVAAAMAAGARDRFACDLTVAVTGIAGPTGGTEHKPAGTVCFATADAAGETCARLHLDGDRHTVRAAATAHALKMLIDAAAGAS